MQTPTTSPVTKTAPATITWTARDRVAIARGEEIARRPHVDLYVSASR